LIDVRRPRHPEGVVVVLHGGGSRGDGVHVSPTQLSVLRMVPLAQRVARAGRGRLAVVRLLNSYRGWSTSHTPVQDAEWALDQVRERYGELPVGLVGHSLGGRAALLAAGDERVRSVVALNPWLYPNEPTVPTTAAVLVVHGLQDRVAAPSRSLSYVEHLAQGGNRAAYLAVRDGKHAMLRHGRTFDRCAAEFTAATLLPGGRAPWGPVGRVLDGDLRVTV
jgi:alpha-beta hydrolase superfamily lysophospholipase